MERSGCEVLSGIGRVYPTSQDGGAALAQAWGDAVRGNRAQAERLREAPDGGDHYAPIASVFRADPHRTDDATLDALRDIARPDDVWIDIGAGAGRFALALARSVCEVIAIEPSAGMREEFEAVRAQHGIENVRLLDQRWPTDDPPRGDVAMISHVGYDIEPIGEFLDTMERAAARECVAVLFESAPGGLFSELWPAVHGEPQIALPGLDALLALLEARGAAAVVQRSQQRSWSFESREDAEAAARRRLWIEPNSPKLPALRRSLDELLTETEDGRLATPGAMTQGIVRWRTDRHTEQETP